MKRATYHAIFSKKPTKAKYYLGCSVACSMLVLSPYGSAGQSRSTQPLVVSPLAVAQQSAILISGNQRIERATILRYAGLRDGAQADAEQVNEAVKQLYLSGFFADASIRQTADGLLINVAENPTVHDVLFEGNDDFDSEQLLAELQLRPRGIYTRPKIQSDVARLLALYRRSGRFSAEVRPTLVQKEQNRVDIVYEITEGPVTKVGQIEFIGNSMFDDATLRDVVNTSTECFYCFLTDNDKYDPDRVAYDKELLRRFYTTQGYADFNVTSVLSELSPQRDTFFITFTIDEGARYRIGEVKFDSQLPGTTADELMEYVEQGAGDLYNADAIERSISSLVDHLGDKGFAFVDIDPELIRNDDQTINLAYKVKEGPRVYVERINIEGNMRTLDRVVRREFRLAEGDPYSTSKLQRSEQRLRNLGFFEDVKITTNRGSTEDRVVVNVAVEERSTGEVTFGAGFSTVDGPLADVGIRERNLLGRGQELRLRGTFAAERQQFDLGFTEPYFLGRDVRAGFDLFKTTQDFSNESSFDRESIGGRLRFGYAVTENLRQDLYYSYLKSEVTDVDDNASRFIRDQEGVNVTSLVGQTLTYDKLDNRISPTSGYLLRMDLDVAGFGGDSKFIRPEGRAQLFHTFYPQVTLMLRGTGGYVYALDDDIRIQDRFFLGGRDVRGFDNAGIGPRDVTTGDALGGNIYYTGTTELQFPLGLPDDLGFKGAIFVDVASLYGVDDTGAEVVDDQALRAAAGLGLAWSSPFGPVRIDFSHAFLKEEYDVEETIRFSFGTPF